MLSRILVSLPILFSLVAATSADDKLTFDDDILPIFENYCLECHNQDESRGGLDLSTYGATMAGGSGGEILNPGRSDESKVYLVTAKIEGEPMPPRGQGLNKNELDVLKNWITGGVLENVNSTPKKPKENKLTMSMSAATLGKPEGPPPMPEHLLLEPVVVTERAAATSAIATSPWAPLAAVAGQKQVLLYHTDNHRLAGVLPFPEGHIESLNFSRNSRLLLAGGGVPGKNGRVVAFDVRTGKRQLELGREFDTILSADISADQAFVAFGSPGKLVKILETGTGEEAAVIKKHTDWVTAVRYSPDGKKLATGDRQGNLFVWEGDTGNILHELRGHKGAIGAVEWRADSQVLAAISGDGFAILWEMKEGKQVKRFEAHKGGGLDLDFHRDTTLATVGRDKRARIWNAEGKMLGQTEPIAGEPLAIRFRHDGKQLIV
ncbi:MAG: c-type cytochrome domain-containing protein, partial [Verrucomicrobiota bacterium]